jgi:hypothetical protein
MQPTLNEAELDRRFIAAFIPTDQDLLQALYRESASVEEVDARAARMGLTTDFVRRCRLTGTTPQMRTCVKCDARFLSVGAQNRLCKRCPPR